MEKAVNHNGHNEQNVKTTSYTLSANHPLGKSGKHSKPLLFVAPVVPLQGGVALSLRFELRF